MKFENILAVSGLPGLYNMVTSRGNGILISDLDTEKTRFCSVRKHQFTPLETVAIYTVMDTTPLKEVLKSMADKEPTLAVPSVKEKSPVLSEYFGQVLEDYDPDRVQISDIKKIIKWFNFLKERDLLKTLYVAASSGEEEE